MRDIQLVKENLLTNQGGVIIFYYSRNRKHALCFYRVLSGNLPLSSESYRKSSENRQKRHYVLRQFYIKLKLLGRSEIRNFSSRVENYFAALTREILFNTRR